jgi:hypothetical protein
MMDKRERAILFRSIAETTREYITGKIDGIDQKIQSIPAPLKGEKGDRGEKGESGEAVVGPQGPVGEKGERGERGERGDPGESVKGEKGEKGIPGDPGSKGDAGSPGVAGQKGETGAPGLPGRDALQIDILPAADLTRSYPRGTFARHDGGVIRSFRDTIPGESLEKAGWEVVLAGLSEVEVVQQEDPRVFTLRTRLTGGQSKENKFRLPVLVYRGIYAPGKYSQGDVVTWGGSAWHCQGVDVTSAPGKNGDWKLMVKEGQRGKDGKDGAAIIGPQGPPGRDGKDLTQLSFDGAKH